MCGAVNLVVFCVKHGIKQAVVEESIEVKVHLLRAEVCLRHDVRLFDSACRRDKDIMYDIEFASIL